TSPPGPSSRPRTSTSPSRSSATWPSVPTRTPSKYAPPTPSPSPTPRPWPTSSRRPHAPPDSHSPGSACSIIFGDGLTDARPSTVQGLHLVVSAIEQAHKELTCRGVDVTGAFHQAGEKGRVAGPHPQRASYGSFASFADPDGNRWFLQEITERLPG